MFPSFYSFCILNNLLKRVQELEKEKYSLEVLVEKLKQESEFTSRQVESRWNAIEKDIQKRERELQIVRSEHAKLYVRGCIFLFHSFFILSSFFFHSFFILSFSNV